MRHQNQSASRRVLKFLDFRLDFGARTLTRNGDTVVLTPKVFDTLRLLVERQGEFVTKEEFLATIWPNTSVEESNLTQNIFTIRKLLAEKETGRKIIETRSGLGYRFLPEVRSEAESEVLPVTATVDAVKAPPQTQVGDGRSRLGLVVAALVVLAIGAALTRDRSRQTTELTTAKKWGLGSRAGWENFPAVAPDGTRVAFVWDGGRDRGPAQLYVQQVPKLGSLVSNARALTSGSGPSTACPIWSPDGQRLAFVRHTAGTSALYIIGADGSGERKIRDLRPATFAYTGCPASFSADGQFIGVAVAAEDGGAELRRVALETGADGLVTVPDAGGGRGYHNPVYSPDGRYLALVHYYNRDSADVVIVPAWPDGRINGQPLRLTNDRLPIHGLAWAPESRSIIYSATRNGSDALWRIGLNGDAPQLVPGGDQGQYPSISARGGKLSFAVLNENRSLWRIPLSSAGDIAGPPSMLTPSTRRDEGPVFSPDGRNLSFFSDRTGSYEVWICDANGNSPHALTAFGGAFAGLSHWSPDGRTLVFDAVTPLGKHDIFTIPAKGGDARLLIQGPSLDVVPTWSRDGRHVYFTSDRSGRFQVWRAERDGRNPVQITEAGGWYAREAEDGYLYYSSASRSVEIRRVLPSGGAEETVVREIRPRFWGHWTMNHGRIFLIHTPDHLGGDLGLPTELWLFDVASRSLRNLGSLPGSIFEATPAVAVSPDGRSLVYSRIDSAAGDLFMLDNFR